MTRRDGIAALLGALATLVALVVVACAHRPPDPSPQVPVIVPAERRADELATAEQTHRLAAAQAQAQVQQAQAAVGRATTAAERAQADRDRIAAEAIHARETLLAAEVQRLRRVAEADAVRQRDELDARTAKIEAEATLRQQQVQAASDRRAALLWGGLATGGAVLVAGVLAWAGLPWSTAFRLPAIVATAAAVLVGILEAGPLLTVLLAAVTLLGACWGMVVLVRALRLSIDHGRRARQVNPADPVQVKRLEDTSRDNATAAGLYALFKHHLAKD